MKKIIFGFVVVVSAFFAMPLSTHAQSSEQTFGARVSEGEINLSNVSPILNFDLGSWGKNTEGYIYPNVYIPSISFPDQESSTFFPNPYENSQPVIDPEPWFDEKDCLVKITNYRSSNPDFKITLTRTPFVNTTTKKELSGEYLYFGSFHDSLDYKGVNRSVEAGTPNKYWLAKSATINVGQSTLIADYRGEAALGEHWISPFNVPNTDANGYRPFDNRVFENEDERIKAQTYEEKNIALAINSETVIPSSGDYTTTLIWTLERTA